MDNEDQILVRAHWHDIGISGSYPRASGSYWLDEYLAEDEKISILKYSTPTSRFIICQWCTRRNPTDAWYCEGCGGPL